MKNKVSIIIPAFNASKFIVETLDSALQQTHKNIEIIIIDDYSKDNTWEIIQSYKFNYPNLIRAYKNERKGASAARNYGFELSRGDYIQYLDADDILSKNKLSTEVDLLMSSGDSKAIAFSKWHHFDTVLEDYKVNNQLVYRDYSPGYKILIDMWTQGEMIQTSCWLTPRTIIESIDGWNEEFKSNPTDDSEFFARVLLKCSKIVFDKQGIVYYRRPEKGNLSQNFNIDGVESILKSYKSYESILVLNSSELVKRALAQNYLNFIYSYYSKFPRLIIQSEQHFHDLGFKKMWPVGGNKFRKMAKIIGFKKSLGLRELIRKIKKRLRII